MGPAPVCNTTLEDNRISELPIHGTLTFHRIALICVGVLTTISLGLSAWLMFQHATHYSKPWEQKQILRILSIVPVYGVTSLLIVGFYQNYVYFTIISQLYEPLAVVSYLTLICHLVAGSMKELDIWLRTKEAKPWIFPLNLFAKCTGGQRSPFRTPRTAMTQFNIIWFCVYQYCVVRLVTTIAGLIAQATDRYCQTSLNPQYAHLWLAIIPALSIVVAMHCLIQAHFTVRRRLKQHNVTMKLLCIKLVVFLTFWQGIIFGLATSKAAEKINPYIGQTDLEVVLQHLLLSIELVIFAILHHKAYSWSIYALDTPHDSYQGGTLGWRAFVDCFNVVDVGRSIYRGFYWIIVDRKHRNVESYGQESSVGLADRVVVEPKH